MRKSPFTLPIYILMCLIFFSVLYFFDSENIYGKAVLWIAIAVGSWQLLKDTWQSLMRKSFALDYIALMAITTGVVTQNYFVAGVIVLMMSGGNALETYAQSRAKESLTALKNRLPNKVQTVSEDGEIQSKSTETVTIGTKILIRKGEVVPLDGTLLTPQAVLDESSLTGEAMPVSRSAGEIIRSGSLNTGEVIHVLTTVESRDSTYQKIIQLVIEAETVKTPFVQLADKLSGWFTLVTLVMAGLAYLISGEVTRSLAVLVIATPCPLILATPIALVGGMNAAARHRIIFKQLASLESLARIDTLVFDKTGTLTLGIPQLDSITIKDDSYTEQKVLKIASSIEKNSLHPFALAIVDEATKRDIQPVVAESIKEELGVGLSGVMNKKRYYLSSDQKQLDSQVVLKTENKTIATFRFLDNIKEATVRVVASLYQHGFKLYILSGDTPERTEALIKKLTVPIQFQASLSPAEKQNFLKSLKKKAAVAMIGDGINDAPALAIADVGIAFSHQQHTATSEAADVVLLGNDIKAVQNSVLISQYTMQIAKQSMYVGMVLSLLGMSFALAGQLPPLVGAVIQECIDVLVILNALRAATWKENH